MTAGILCTKKSNRDKRPVSTPTVTGWLIGACETPTHGSARKTRESRREEAAASVARELSDELVGIRGGEMGDCRPAEKCKK